MTPNDHTGGEPELTPDEDRAVSDLLGSLRDQTPPVPDDVRSRLDEVLVGLVAERDGDPAAAASPGDSGASGARATSGRWARRWPTVLVAAAAVSVLGVGVGVVVENTGGSGAEDNAVAGSAAEESAGDSATRLRRSRDGAAADAQKAPDPLRSGLESDAVTEAREGLTLLRSGSLNVDTQRLADVVLVSAPAAGRSGLPRGCDPPDAGQGDDVFAVRLDRRPAAVVFRAEDDGVRRADVYACGDGNDPVATTFVTAPSPR